MTTISERIEARMAELGLSETQTATEAAMARMTFKRRLVDPMTMTVGELERLASALDTNVLWLTFGDEGESTAAAS